MRFTITLLFIFFVFINVSAQKSSATLFFKDGTSQQGYVIGDASWDIRFSKELKGKKTTYDFKELDSLHITENEQLISYHIQKYRFGKSSKKSKKLKYTMAQLIIDGPVRFYIQKLKYTTPESVETIRYSNGHVEEKTALATDYSQHSLFVIKPDEDRLFWLYTPGGGLFSRNFKNAATEYFQDCPAVIAKIESGEFNSKTVAKMVQFYNNQCQ
ncbi:hypothetical protein ACFO3O_06015 [Dokdonia ponticola]|uniref:Uncharacterized protein n=1 Tax=Dokdonia ponticola TaxID=2041041 RepID=A0ABV9HTB6_9FLAO